jgi:hypothetical protein
MKTFITHHPNFKKCFSGQPSILTEVVPKAWLLITTTQMAVCLPIGLPYPVTTASPLLLDWGKRSKLNGM